MGSSSPILRGENSKKYAEPPPNRGGNVQPVMGGAGPRRLIPGNGASK